MPGEKLNIVKGEVQGAQYEIFERAFLRQLAAGLNVSYEELSRDFSNVFRTPARNVVLVKLAYWLNY